MKRRSLLRPVVLAVSLAFLPACTGSSPTAPRDSELTIRYVWTGEVLPATDPMCPHHNAPVDSVLTTSWGQSERMTRLDDGSWRLETQPVPPGEHHMQLVDIRHCGVDNTAWVTEGFSVEGIPLTRTAVVEGIPNVFFVLEAGGRVLP